MGCKHSSTKEKCMSVQDDFAIDAVSWHSTNLLHINPHTSINKCLMDLWFEAKSANLNCVF